MSRNAVRNGPLSSRSTIRGAMPPARYTPPVATTVRARFPAWAPRISQKRSSARSERQSVPARACRAITAAGSSCSISARTVACSGATAEAGVPVGVDHPGSREQPLPGDATELPAQELEQAGSAARRWGRSRCARPRTPAPGSDPSPRAEIPGPARSRHRSARWAPGARGLPSWRVARSDGPSELDPVSHRDEVVDDRDAGNPDLGGQLPGVDGPGKVGRGAVVAHDGTGDPEAGPVGRGSLLPHRSGARSGRAPDSRGSDTCARARSGRARPSSSTTASRALVPPTSPASTITWPPSRP